MSSFPLHENLPLAAPDPLTPILQQKNRRDKQTWIATLKERILRGVGRENNTDTRIEQNSLTGLNISGIIPQLLNVTVDDGSQIAEKIRSYYPACKSSAPRGRPVFIRPFAAGEIPRNTDQELWKDENAMNLYFNFDHVIEDSGVNIASATLRLYRLSQTSQNGTAPRSRDPDCDTPEEDRLLRVSIYWYTRSLRKHRGESGRHQTALI